MGKQELCVSLCGEQEGWEWHAGHVQNAESLLDTNQDTASWLRGWVWLPSSSPKGFKEQTLGVHLPKCFKSTFLFLPVQGKG